MAKKSISIVIPMIGGALVASIVWMLGPGTRWILENIDGVTGLTGKDLAAALDAVRGRVLAVATGLAALLAVFYTARNADTARRSFQLGERGHVTDRYSKAVEQLGSPQAPVRLGGLYALEQLAQGTPDPGFRQTIVDVICAYLRMPFTPPTEGTTSEPAGRDPQEERQVRLAAQRILADHLRHHPPAARPWLRIRPADLNARHWPGVRIDLSGATLIDLDLRSCHISEARFAECVFIGDSTFAGSTFVGDAMFDGTVFNGAARFGGTTFDGAAWFERATFTGAATFAGATFTIAAQFEGATFDRAARFTGATFVGAAWFGGATFAGAWFAGATFDSDAWFGGATFTDSALFERAVGLETAALGGVQLAPVAKDVVRIWPTAWKEAWDGTGGRTLRLAQPPAEGADEDREPGESSAT
ncbi:pentapeptide repeat-containing protein [Nonomuraea sp. NPDC049758]|uniref:pentapeptide repeat-containing protein n=1 Tax=Nonomuraea sp. NPDC049758 TaxID=3154360 RepID=UPI00343DD32B